MEDVWSVLARLRVRPDVQNILFSLRKAEALEKTIFLTLERIPRAGSLVSPVASPGQPAGQVICMQQRAPFAGTERNTFF